MAGRQARWWAIGLGCWAAGGVAGGEARDGPADVTPREALYQAVAADDHVEVRMRADQVAALEGKRAIPYLIGVVAADNGEASKRWVGIYSLRTLAGVEWSPYHDGPWWRRWWAAHRGEFPPDARDEPIPDLPPTELGALYRPFPPDIDTLQGKLRIAGEVLAENEPHRAGIEIPPRIDLGEYAASVARHRDPRAIPYLVAMIRAEAYAADEVGPRGIAPLAGLDRRPGRDAAWWLAWWRDARDGFDPAVRAIAPPDVWAPVFDWAEDRAPAHFPAGRPSGTIVPGVGRGDDRPGASGAGQPANGGRAREESPDSAGRGGG